MRGARDSFRTLKASLREWEDYDRGRHAVERYASTPDGEAEGLHEEVDGDEAVSPRGCVENVVRLWLERPDRLREVRQRSDGALEIGVLDGERWWRYDPEWGVASNENEPAVGSDIGDSTRHLFDPSPLLAELSLELAGRTTIAGRSAIRVRARRRRSGFSFGLIHLGREAEGYEFLIDAERGIVLREAAVFEAEEYHIREMLEVVFDDEISPQTFVLDAPAEARETPTPGEARDVGIEDAALLASFAVFAPRLTDEWRQRVRYLPRDERSAYPETVLLTYWLEDASHRLDIYARRQGDEDVADDYGDWEKIERGETAIEVSTQKESLHARVRRDADGTSVMLSSENLGPEALIEIALSLERVSNRT